jgi:DNA-binding response OmpR family regulator
MSVPSGQRLPHSTSYVTSTRLITLDLGLPDLDGLQIAKDLRSLSTAPVLMITARASANDQFNGMAAGASAYLIKPFHPQELRDAVASLCPARSTT